MAYKIVILLSVYCLVLIPLLTVAQSNCGGLCTTGNDCAGQLTCINGQCTDDPSVGTNICGGSGGQTGSCQQSGTLTCESGTYPTYDCSPPVTTSTSAILTNNDFSNGGDGGAESECDQSFHENTELIVALSTGWYDNGSRCFRTVRITASNGNSVDAKVIDECDSRNGCDAEHAGLPPCRNNIVDGSNAVWEALGLNTNDGEASMTWSLV